VVALSWYLLLDSATRFDWLNSIQLSWFALGLIPGKIAIVRSSFPLPVERTEEHYRYQDAARRIGIRVLSALGWFLVSLLFAYALRHALSSTAMDSRLQWLTVGVSWAFGLYSIILMFRGMHRLAVMGRDLRPPGSWSTPYRRASWVGVNRSYMVWFAIWFGGILASVLYSQFR
jgi:hypothetical protein